MRSTFVLLIGFFLSTPAHSRISNDWRTDTAAYQSYMDNHGTPAPQKSFGQLSSPYRIDSAEFKSKLQEFVALGSRGDVQNKTLARQWLAKEYSAIGFQVSEHKYSTGVNFIAERPGASGKVLIISAHLDSVGNAGADDDGTGIIASLIIAEKLKDLKINHTLRVLAFDQEERNLDGSQAYVGTLKKSSVLGDIQLEMMGVNARKDGAFHVIDCKRDNSVFLTQAILNEIQTYSLPIVRSTACTNESDHAAFWSQKMPAVVLSENFFGGDADPCYHEECDIVDDRLNFDYASAIATAVAGATAKIIQK